MAKNLNIENQYVKSIFKIPGCIMTFVFLKNYVENIIKRPFAIIC
jgi:hypothetical protein